MSFRPIAACAALLVPTLLCAEPSSLEEVLADVQTKQQRVETYSADVDMQVSDKGMNTTMSGTQQSKGELSSTVMTMSVSGQKMSMRSVVDASGTTWFEMDMMGTKQVMKSSAGAANPGGMFSGMTGMGSGPDKMFDDLHGQFDLSYSGRETLDGVEVYVLSGQARADALKNMNRAEAAMMNSVKFCIGVDDGVPRRIETFSKDGKPSMTQNWKNVLINEPIADAVFVYTPPAGAQVMDMGSMGIGQGRRN